MMILIFISYKHQSSHLKRCYSPDGCYYGFIGYFNGTLNNISISDTFEVKTALKLFLIKFTWTESPSWLYGLKYLKLVCKVWYIICTFYILNFLI